LNTATLLLARLSPKLVIFLVCYSILLASTVHTFSAAVAAEPVTDLVKPDPALPGGMSLWALLDAEAADAAAHAGFAVNHPSNLDNIQRHTRHVRHLIEPAAEPNRPMPGRDHGVAPTARTMMARLASDDQGLDVQARQNAESALRHALGLSERILENCATIIAASSAEEAIAPARANTALLDAMRDGESETDRRLGLTQLKRVLKVTD